MWSADTPDITGSMRNDSRTIPFAARSHLILLGLCLATQSWAVTVRVAGRVVSSTPAPLDVNGQLLVPAPFLSEWLGIRVESTEPQGTWQLSSFGRWLKVYESSPSFKVDGTRLEAQIASEVRDGVLFVPAEILRRAFAIAAQRSAPGEWDIRPPGAAVSDVREGPHEDYLRLVVDVTGPAPAWASVSEGEIALELPPPDPLPTGWGCLRLFSFEDALRPQAKVTPGPEDWSKVLITYSGGGLPQITTLGDPTRIVIDIPRRSPLTAPTVTPPAETRTTTPVAPIPSSTPWQVRNFGTQRGAVRVFVLKASPTAVRPALAAATIRQRAPVSLIARRAGASAAVNGGYFDWSGPPLGMLVIDGEWIKAPMYRRCVLGLSEAGEALMDRLHFRGIVEIQGAGKISLEALNTGHASADTAILYTRRWGSEVSAAPGFVRATISPDGTIGRVELTGNPVAIPRDAHVLSAGGRWAGLLARARLGARTRISLDTEPRWPKLRYALGAGPRLVKAGQVAVTAAEERFRADVLRTTSRSAVGLHPDGNVLVAAMESTQAGGVTLDEAACIMLKLGCHEAMSLDGGGSTTVIDGGRVINHPIGGSERPVSNALLIFGRS